MNAAILIHYKQKRGARKKKNGYISVQGENYGDLFYGLADNLTQLDKSIKFVEKYVYPPYPKLLHGGIYERDITEADIANLCDLYNKQELKNKRINNNDRYNYRRQW